MKNAKTFLGVYSPSACLQVAIFVLHNEFHEF